MGCTYVSPSYFEVLGIPVVKGSATLREREAIIDRAAVARLGLVEPVGAVIDIRVLGQFTVVGMVADATLSDREITANVFLPLTPAASSGRHLLFRSPRLVSVLPAVEQLMNRLAPGIPFSRAVSADTHVRRYFANVTTNAALGAVAAVAAMVLSVTSLGVVAARLAQLLASSLALRAVLGASQGTLAWTVARSMLPWLLGGAVNGTIAGWVLLLITGAEIDIYRVAPYVVAAALVPVIAIIGVGLKLMLGSMRVSVLLR